MSAIAAVYTSRLGFVIGADGRARWNDPDAVDQDKKQLESEQEQKIFEATSKNAIMAYAITGAAYNEDKSFSVIAESEKIATSLSALELVNHLEYVQRFSQLVSASISATHQKDLFDYSPAKICAPGHENSIVRLVFCGYFRKVPFAYDVEIVNEHGILSCQPVQYDIRLMGPVVLGSEVIAKLMYNEEDIRFRRYIVRISQDSSARDAVACVKGYLEACSTPLARTLDPFCEIIGGHIHVAKITPGGFDWIIPPIRSDD